LEPVAVAIAIFVDPLEARLCGRQVPLDQRRVAGGPPRRVERDEIERRRVGGAVVRRMRDQFEVRQLAATQFMQDLARLGIAIIVAHLRLELPQHL
jgi:hypothetical protein